MPQLVASPANCADRDMHTPICLGAGKLAGQEAIGPRRYRVGICHMSTRGWQECLQAARIRSDAPIGQPHATRSRATIGASTVDLTSIASVCLRTNSARQSRGSRRKATHVWAVAAPRGEANSPLARGSG